ncbi:putative dolichyl pyrophosphate Glc1Man9GlcNAc2 alpha-1 [Abeliophyllum distichum]|uniref:Alpha-1,3-glucosyltransferase n=1 Tax=Abeliophyllum distichum TaxID=126358 RepID=A0ABD1RSE4_9LAMI
MTSIATSSPDDILLSDVANLHVSPRTRLSSTPKAMKKPPNHWRISDIWWFALVATAMKLLLIPAYRSTDFEVHRHWLALTHSLPLSRWYSDTTSPWTLDYPPFFAYFEKFLSFFASLVDPTMTHLHKGLNYTSPLTILFQRLSVIFSDVLLIYSTRKLSKDFKGTGKFLMWALIIWSPGLFIVDHLHFQYNGFMLGMLLLSLSYLEEGRDVMGGFVFAVLLCFKHLFAVAAPVYFVYLFRHYCRGGFVKGSGRLVVMGSVVLAVFAVAYGPFVYYGQIQQVFRRMFPFGRGLCHAYWAPNFWPPTASFTGGLVGDSSPFAVLPTITPLITLITVLLAISPCLIKTWRDPQPRMVTRWVAYAYTCGFLFGWHVHEKASLHFVIPLSIIALKSAEDAKHYFFLSIVSCYSLFPLLFEAQEYPIKVSLLLLHAVLMWFGFSSHFSKSKAGKASSSVLRKDDKFKSPNADGDVKFVLGWYGKAYLLGLFVVEIWGQFLHPIIFAAPESVEGNTNESSEVLGIEAAKESSEVLGIEAAKSRQSRPEKVGIKEQGEVKIPRSSKPDKRSLETSLKSLPLKPSEIIGNNKESSSQEVTFHQ